MSEVKGEPLRLSLGYIMTWSLSSPLGRQLLRCCLLSTQHLYPILTYFVSLEDILSITKMKLQKWTAGSSPGHLVQLHNAKLYRELFKGVLKAVRVLPVLEKVPLNWNAIEGPHEVCELWSGAQGFDVSFWSVFMSKVSAPTLNRNKPVLSGGLRCLHFSFLFAFLHTWEDSFLLLSPPRVLS